MKRIFTHSACLFWALLLAAVFSGGTAVGQKQTPILDSVSPSCVEVGSVGENGLEVQVEGSKFDTKGGKKTDSRFRMQITDINGSEIGIFYPNEGFTAVRATFKLPSSLFTATRTLIIRVQNANGESSLYKWETSTPLNFYIMAPPTATASCVNGAVTLQASGALTGGAYQWYDSAEKVLEGETNATYIPNAADLSKTFYVAAVSPSGCEGPRASVVAQTNGKSSVTGGITSSPEELEVGVEATFSVASNIIDYGHAASIEWFIVKDGIRVQSLGRGLETSVKYTPQSNEPFEVECDVTPVSSSCYAESPKTFTTQVITPLPVEIIYFTAAKQGNNVLLEWATASEQNNTGFEVQVSQDGFNFRKLDFVPTKNGNTVIKQVYTFKDTENGKYGTRYYRLKQIDMDGQFEYFTTKAVSFGEVSSYSLKAFPNPFESEVTLELNADEAGKLNVQVLDAMGRSVLTKQFEVSKGRSMEKLTLWQSLPKGIYFVRTEMNGIANNFKLLKK